MHPIHFAIEGVVKRGFYPAAWWRTDVKLMKVTTFEHEALRLLRVHIVNDETAECAVFTFRNPFWMYSFVEDQAQFCFVAFRESAARQRIKLACDAKVQIKARRWFTTVCVARETGVTCEHEATNSGGR